MILLLSIVGIAVGLSVHFTATEPATTITPVPSLIATTLSPILTTTTTEGILFQTYFFRLIEQGSFFILKVSGQNTLLTLTKTTIKATLTASSSTPGIFNSMSFAMCFEIHFEVQKILCCFLNVIFYFLSLKGGHT